MNKIEMPKDFDAKNYPEIAIIQAEKLRSDEEYHWFKKGKYADYMGKALNSDLQDGDMFYEDGLYFRFFRRYYSAFLYVFQKKQVS